MHFENLFKMSPLEEHLNETSETHIVEQIDGTNTEVTPHVMDERIKANLEPLHAQITTLTQMMNKLREENLARTKLTAGCHDLRLQSEFPHTGEPGTSRTLPLLSTRTAGYSTDPIKM